MFTYGPRYLRSHCTSDKTQALPSDLVSVVSLAGYLLQVIIKATALTHPRLSWAPSLVVLVLPPSLLHTETDNTNILTVRERQAGQDCKDIKRADVAKKNNFPPGLTGKFLSRNNNSQH